jgi:formylglycine-generating enzyme required for sulfatase activity
MPEDPHTSPRKLKAFLCHSSGDKPAVRELYQHLLADGFQPWLDEEDILPGEDWDETIRKAVRQSDVVIVCLSGTSINKTGYIQKEIKFALDVADMQPEGKIFIIPVRLEECKVPERLSRWQWVDLDKGSGYKKLLNGLKACEQNSGIRKLGPGLPPQLIKLSTETKFVNFVTIGEMEFLLIPKGKFLMGSRDDNSNARNDEKPQHTIELADFYINRYPVTNRQFNKFIQATHNKHQWIEGWQEKLDHPVVNVSWQDTMAFCQWLNHEHKEHLPKGLVFTLPTEAEWEKAARGEFGREYPWGDMFDPNCCNSSESGQGGTTPVGMYSPQGDSLYGVADMAGNVWEWCYTLYMPYTYRPGDGWEDNSASRSRVLRGGAWGDDQRHARCACRYRSSPGFTGNPLGFRCALSFPSGLSRS